MTRYKNPGIYIHIPFCRSKCPYCDFFSVTDTGHIDAFLEALSTEITVYGSSLARESEFDTVYLGGGTPSLLAAGQLQGILEKLSGTLRISPAAEITLEVNPGSITLAKLKQIREMGFNRLSIGVQSFNDTELQQIGRLHTASEAKRCITQARDSGFRNIGIDLIYALPGQSLAAWQDTLSTAIGCQPEHISAYNLTWEPGTPFYAALQQGRFHVQDEESDVAFYQHTHDKLAAAGYIHYEVSNFAVSAEHFSGHNCKYWNHSPYLGFGPAAHSFWENNRWQNIRSVEKYAADLAGGRLPVSFREHLKPAQLLFEFIFLSLRTSAGLDLEDFYKRFDHEFTVMFKEKIRVLMRNGHAMIEGRYFRLTQKGMLICDTILPLFAAA